MTHLLGLTGSIGMGKTTVAGMFRHLGVPIFDADAVVRALQGPGGQLLSAIETLHPGTTGPAGVDRALLGRLVFNDPAALRRLERVIHPEVERARRSFLRRHRAHPLAVVDVPLLFEKGGWRRVWKQRARVMARPGMSCKRLRQIHALQIADSIKRRRSDMIIPTGGTIGATRASVRRITACLRARAKR
jgi:dephospho-CoA kinase